MAKIELFDPQPSMAGSCFVAGFVRGTTASHANDNRALSIREQAGGKNSTTVFDGVLI